MSSLENTKDPSKVTLVELLNALQAQEKRRLMRVEGVVEGALQAELQVNQGGKNKEKKFKKWSFNSQQAANITSNNTKVQNKEFLKCWKRPDVKCEKCHKIGHHEKIC